MTTVSPEIVADPRCALTWRDATGTAHRIRFEQIAPGHMERVEEVFEDDGWRRVGSETVADVRLATRD